MNFERTRSVAAAAIGNVLEWYDFSIYAFAAGTIGRKFFPDADQTASLLAAFAAFGVGFLIRPIGGIVIGRLGDSRGRKSALTTTIILMAVGTVGIGILPDRQAIGALAPLLLVLCRCVQGFSAGGEWGSSTAFIVEWAPVGRRGFFGSLQQSSVCGGLLLGSVSAALMNTLLTPDQTDAWGWRIPFLAGAALAPVGLYLRRNVGEPPAFRAARTLPTPIGRGAGWVLAAKACGFHSIQHTLPAETSESELLALVEALKNKRIAGAALDVFSQEPLPTDHPFWSMQNVIITTHQGGFCDVYVDYALPVIEKNMARFLNGDTGGMINVVAH